MRRDSVVMDTPLFDQDLGVAQVVEHLTIEQLLAEPGVTGFADRPSAKPIAANNLDHISTSLQFVQSQNIIVLALFLQSRASSENYYAPMVRKRRIKVGNQTTNAGSAYGVPPLK